MTNISQLLRLNARVAGLALRGRWLSPRDVGEGYNRVALTYNNAWQYRLRPVTDQFLTQLPSGLGGTLLDLGCGTGYTTKRLASLNPATRVIGVDISDGMLAEARNDPPANAEFVSSDMLQYLESAPNGMASMVVSTWALGYSKPSRLFAECHRVLKEGSTLGFVVNFMDTLAPVFRSFQKCLLNFPDSVYRAAWPRFPRDWKSLRTQLERVGFSIEWHKDGTQPIVPPEGPLVPWIKQTGILAGFDAMLDLSGPAAESLETELQKQRTNIFHHYAAVRAKSL